MGKVELWCVLAVATFRSLNQRYGEREKEKLNSGKENREKPFLSSDLSFLSFWISILFIYDFFFLGKIPYFWLFFHLNQDEILPYIRIKINIALSISICLSIHKSVLSKWSDSMRPNFQLCFKTMNVRYFCHLDSMNCIRIDCNRVPISSEKMRFSATGE